MKTIPLTVDKLFNKHFSVVIFCRLQGWFVVMTFHLAECNLYYVEISYSCHLLRNRKKLCNSVFRYYNFWLFSSILPYTRNSLFSFSQGRERKSTRKYVVFCAIYYHLYNLKNVKNIHGGVLFLVKLQSFSLQLD